MADDLVFMEGFDDGLADVRTSLPAAAISSSYGLHGNGGRCGDNTAYGIYIPTTNPFLVGFNVYVTDSGGTSFMEIGNYTDFLYDGTLGRIGFSWYKGSLYTPAGSVPMNEWHYVECLVYSNTVNGGYVKLWVDGVLEAEQSSLDFQSNDIGSVELIGGGGSATIDDFYVDDLYVLNNCSISTTPFGPGEVITSLPNGNGNSSQLLGSDGNSADNYQLVDENPPVTTDYVGSGTDGEKDTYAFENVSSGVEIRGVLLSHYAQKTDSGVKYLKPVTRSGGTDYDGSSVGLGEAWGLQDEYMLTDPDTAAPWTEAGFNAAEFGQKVSDT